MEGFVEQPLALPRSAKHIFLKKPAAEAAGADPPSLKLHQ